MQGFKAAVPRLRGGSRFTATRFAVIGLSACLAPALGLAQGPAAPATTAPARSVDPLQAAAQAAFEALPEAERRAIQSDLIWAADFTGAVSGGFGPLTFRALQVFERNAGTRVDGILDSAERQALAETAQKQRGAVKFAARMDTKTQTRISLPDALLSRTRDNALGGSEWKSADEKVRLYTFGFPAQTLEQMFARSTADGDPTRKVTYKLLRPDFFVVTVETSTGKFYRRAVKDGSGTKGFSIEYDKTLAKPWDKLTIAIANAFEPFPGNASQVPPVPSVSVNPAIQATAPPDALQPRRFAKSATGLVVADGKVLTASAGLAQCRDPRVGASALTDVAHDAPTGLALASVQGVRRRPLSITASPSAPLLALAQGEGVRGLLVIPAVATSGTISGAFQPGAAGAAVLDRAGRLAGMLVSDPDARLQVAGTVIAGRHRMTDAVSIARFLTARGMPLAESAEIAPRSTGQITSELSPAVVAISCTN